ncbi:MAG: TIGR03663 family protein, partial [Chloroflexi bacterium]|nr:TIGR03663 family protein [Chloroflexota bacterium]
MRSSASPNRSSEGDVIPDTVRDDPLDRPAISARGITAESLLYALLIAFVLCTRLRDLGARTYCHDESIHAWESWKLATGQGYAHDPAYHGPLLYHLTALVFVLFGDSDVTGRLAAALVGSALTLAPLFLRPWLGRRGALAAMLLMALSPVLMHRSRFIRHDQFAALANLVLLVATLRYLERREQRYLYWAAAAIAVGLSTKETSFIFHTILGLFLALLVLARWIRVRPLTWSAFTASSAFDLAVVLGTLMLPLASPLLIRLLGRDPLSLTSSAIAFSAGVFVAVQVLAAAIGLAWNRRTWLVCVAIFYGIFAPLHTTFFTNWPGFATGMVGQLGYWLAQHGLARGGQPWFYYLILMPMYEFAPLLIGLAGMVYYAVTCRRTAREAPAASEASDAPNSTPFVPLLIGWCIGSFALYSWAGEKMPWLTMHLAIPWHLLAGWTLGKLLDARSQPVGNSSIRLPLDAIGATARGAALAATALLLLLTVRFAWMATFLHGDVANEFLVYAQGAPDVGRVARELEA